MEGSSLAGESGSLSNDKASPFNDPYGDALLAAYRGMNLHNNSSIMGLVYLAPIVIIGAFYFCVSSSTSSVISFSAFVFSIIFLIIAMQMLCEILNKDCGPR
jgi:hypothetical protein